MCGEAALPYQKADRGPRKEAGIRLCSATMSSLYDVSCFAAGLAGTISGFQTSELLRETGVCVAEFLPVWSPLQGTSSPSPSSCRRCKLLASTLTVSLISFFRLIVLVDPKGCTADECVAAAARLLLAFCTPSSRPTFKRVLKAKSTEQFDGLPYLLSLLNCCICLWYGLPWVSDGGRALVATVNCTGALFQLAYISLFIFYADSRTTRVSKFMCLPCLPSSLAVSV